MEVRDGDLGGGDQVEVVARDDVHLVLLVRDLPGPARGGGVHDGRRPDLGEPVLRGVDVEEEVDERALERRAGAAVDGEAGAGDLGAALEVEDAEPLRDVPVRPALPRCVAGGGVRADLAREGTTRGRSSPHVRTVTFASSPPTGTSGSAGFGIRRSEAPRARPRRAASSASSTAIRSPTAIDAARRAADLGAGGVRAAAHRLADPLRRRVALALQPVALARAGRAGARRAASASVDERGVLALVDGALADDVRFLPEPLEADAHDAPLAVMAAAAREPRDDERGRLEPREEPAGAGAVGPAEERGVERREGTAGRDVRRPGGVRRSRACQAVAGGGRRGVCRVGERRRGTPAARAESAAAYGGSRVRPHGEPRLGRRVGLQPRAGR